MFIYLFIFLPLAVVLFRSREHYNCGPQPGCVRAHIESKISFWSDPSFKIQESKLYFVGVLMLSTYYKIGLCTCPLLCFANSCFKGVASSSLGWIEQLFLFLCLDCTFYFLLLRMVSFDLSLQVSVSITIKADIASIWTPSNLKS